MYPTAGRSRRDEKKTKKNEGDFKEDLKPIVPAILSQKIPRHSFAVWQVMLSVRLFCNTNAGFRGIARCYGEFQKYFEIKTVSFCCIRQWTLRLGYGLLHQENERRADWIYIIDFSIQLGKERCLLILGATRQSLIENGYELKHHQVKVLDIYVRESFTGEIVRERLEAAQNKTGTPYQIISDKGNDVRKGIGLFCAKHKSVIATYDVTHMIGISIKHSLRSDPQWLCLQKDLSNLAQQVKQSDVSFLRPIALGKKAKWLNIKQTIDWLGSIYRYQKKADYSLIATGYKISNHGEVYEKLKPRCQNKYDEKRLLKELLGKIFPEKEEAMDWLKEKGYKQLGGIEFIDAGKSRFDEKFNVLDKHKPFFEQLQQLNRMAENIKGSIRNKGLSLETLQELEKEHDNITYPWIRQVYWDIVGSLLNEHARCGADPRPLLCCSDVIESIFGKFKMKARQPVGGIYETVLSIALICTDLTDEVVKEILSKVKMSDVNNWFRSMAGVSNLAKRRIAFR